MVDKHSRHPRPILTAYIPMSLCFKSKHHTNGHSGKATSPGKAQPATEYLARQVAGMNHHTPENLALDNKGHQRTGRQRYQSPAESDRGTPHLVKGQRFARGESRARPNLTG